MHATGAPHGGSNTSRSPADPANPPSDSEYDYDSVIPPASGGSAVPAPSADNANTPHSGYASISVFGGALHGFWGYVRPGDDVDAAVTRDLPSVTEKEEQLRKQAEAARRFVNNIYQRAKTFSARLNFLRHYADKTNPGDY